ncbi:MAG: PadR family transcriptional regulator [Crenarchaeota archaeon]|nr:PadR family transcriptional regulator [Thermoproteota archaeon]
MSTDISAEKLAEARRHIMKRLIRLLILKILSNREAHGYAIIKELEKLLGYRVSSGVVYPHLKRLVREEIIEAIEIYRGNKKIKIYRLTERGRRYVEDHIKDIEEAYQIARRLRKFFNIGGRELVQVLKKLFENIEKLSEEDLSKIRDILRETSRQIENIVRKYE